MVEAFELLIAPHRAAGICTLSVASGRGQPVCLWLLLFVKTIYKLDGRSFEGGLIRRLMYQRGPWLKISGHYEDLAPFGKMDL